MGNKCTGTLSRRLFFGLAGGALFAGGPNEAWQKHGFTGAQYQRVRGLMAGAAEKQQIAGGGLLLTCGGDVVFREAFGYGHLGKKEPFGVDTLCHIASLTKPVTTSVLMQLVDRGEVGLDDPVSRHLPEFENIAVKGKGPASKRPIVRQLVSHRAGFPGNTEFPEHLNALRLAGLTLGEMVTELVKDGLVAEPGTRYAYSRAGFMSAGRIIEVVTGKAFPDAVAGMLFDPLKMTRSTFRPTDSQLAAMPFSYERREGKLVVGRDPSDFPEGFLINPGGGMYSTVDDMSRFLLMHLGGGVLEGRRVLNASSVEAMQVRQPAIPGKGPEHGAYGLGWGLTRQGLGKVRHIGASGTVGWLDPEREIAGVLLTQTKWAGNRPWQAHFTREMNELLG